MRALKVLGEGGIGPFSAFAWPLPTEGAPGAWVEGAADPRSCTRGVHACLPEQLPFWLGPELYVIELGGAISRAPSKVVAERGRLLHRIEAWDEACLRAFALAASLHARDTAAALLRAEGEGALAAALEACPGPREIRAVTGAARIDRERPLLAIRYLRDALAHVASAPVTSAYCAAHAGLDPASYAEERAFQARWLAAELQLG